MAGLLSLGTRSMFASYAALQTTSANISNANTPGYSRQSVELSTAGGQFTGAGFFGKGAKVETVSRAHDEFLTREAALTKSVAASDSARLEQLQRLEKLFPTGESGIGYAAGALLNAFTDVANRPQDISARQVVLSRAEELATRFSNANGQVDALQAGVTQDVRNAVATVNSLAQQIAGINQQIAAVKGVGHLPNDLLDQRDQLVNELSGYMQVTTIPADDGTLSVFIGGGQRLVLSNDALELKAIPDAFDPARVGLGIVEGGVVRTVSTASIPGGSIAGLLRFQNDDLSSARALIGQLATAFAGRLNEQQSLGLDLSYPGRAGQALLGVGQARVLPAASNSGTSQPTITVTDPTRIQPSDYELTADAANPGSFLLTRLYDHTTRSLSAGDLAQGIDGFSVDFGANAPQPGDRFLLQPASQAAAGMRRLLDDPKGIAAASPVSATFAVGNSGTATQGSLKVMPGIDPTLSVQIQFTDDSGGYDWQVLDASNAVVRSGSATWAAAAPFPVTSNTDATPLNQFNLQLNGVPRAGDAITVAPTPYSQANNGNALALLALRDEGLVGRQTTPNGEVPGETITDAYARSLADIGVRVQSAQASSSVSGAVAANAEQVRSSKAGVNLDEEAARLIQFQQAYQASAKVLQIAQSVFDTLMEVAAR